MLRIYCSLSNRMAAMRRDPERGAAAVEYGLLVGLIAVAIILAVYWIGRETQGTFCEVVDALPFLSEDCNAPIPAPGP